ncbi:MAG: SDR family NAD(P)-dependent oxidoreductase [Actinomycetota bacterium]|nr:SDR family NAD(P)-dependent oxidoreductase [Actinomycetota bacterium]
MAEFVAERFVFGGATAVVTGAASGIGAAVAAILGERGSHLALVDRDGAGLDSVADGIRARHPKLIVTTHLVDLGERSEFAPLVDAVAAQHGRVTLLINNAGVALGGRLDQITLDEFDWLMNINFRAVVALTKAFLPQLVEAPGAHLVNVSSLFGLIGPAGQSAYAASKFAVRGFTESVRAELEPRGVGVTTVHPGGIATNIAKNARVGSGVPTSMTENSRRSIDAMLTMPPEVAAGLIVDAIHRRRARLVITSRAKLVDRLVRMMPVRGPRIIGDSMRRSQVTPPSS